MSGCADRVVNRGVRDLDSGQTTRGSVEVVGRAGEIGDGAEGELLVAIRPLGHLRVESVRLCRLLSLFDREVTNRCSEERVLSEEIKPLVAGVPPDLVWREVPDGERSSEAPV